MNEKRRGGGGGIRGEGRARKEGECIYVCMMSVHRGTRYRHIQLNEPW